MSSIFCWLDFSCRFSIELVKFPLTSHSKSKGIVIDVFFTGNSYTTICKMAPKCPKCNDSVYPAEELKCNKFSYHKRCFRCFLCNTGLDSNNVNPHEHELYCKKCHGRKFGIKGYGFGQGAGALGMDEGERQGNIGDSSLRSAPAVAGAYHSANLGSGERTGNGPWCPRCNGTVFTAEEKKGAGQSWHNKCFTCAFCNKRLDSTTLCDKDGEIFCKACYAKEYGAHGVGFGQGSGALRLT